MEAGLRRRSIMAQVVEGSGNSLEEAVADALTKVDKNHVSGEITKTTFDHGGVRGGTEFRVELTLTK